MCLQKTKSIIDICTEIIVKFSYFLLRNNFSPVPLLLSKGLISQMFPMHDEPDLKELRKSWVQAIFSTQPLGKKNCITAISESVNEF